VTDEDRSTGEPLIEQISSIIDRAESNLHKAAPNPPHHPGRETLDRELRAIKDDVLRMGSLVEQAIHGAINALVTNDAEAALAVIHGDRAINDMQRQISTQITTTIARQSPVARDLRFLLALDHVTYELERMGDHAASVAKQARKLAGMPPVKRYINLPEIGTIAARLVHGILRALVEVDEVAARSVAAEDDEIDHRYHRIFDQVLDLMRADPANVDRGARILFAAHYLERIGDRVTNIAEDVVFLATGEIEDLNP
jgi:phosphate transport system protein